VFGRKGKGDYSIMHDPPSCTVLLRCEMTEAGGMQLRHGESTFPMEVPVITADLAKAQAWIDSLHPVLVF